MATENGDMTAGAQAKSWEACQPGLPGFTAGEHAAHDWLWDGWNYTCPGRARGLVGACRCRPDRLLSQAEYDSHLDRLRAFEKNRRASERRMANPQAWTIEQHVLIGLGE